MGKINLSKIKKSLSQKVPKRSGLTTKYGPPVQETWKSAVSHTQPYQRKGRRVLFLKDHEIKRNGDP